jgi:hypothetical protein
VVIYIPSSLRLTQGYYHVGYLHRVHAQSKACMNMAKDEQSPLDTNSNAFALESYTFMVAE